MRGPTPVSYATRAAVYVYGTRAARLWSAARFASKNRVGTFHGRTTVHLFEVRVCGNVVPAHGPDEEPLS